VWSVGERPGFVEDVQAMRRRVESTLKGDQVDREVKLGPGGLRGEAQPKNSGAGGNGNGGSRR